MSSVLGNSFQDTPLVVPVSGHLDSVKRFMKGDYYHCGEKIVKLKLIQK